MTFTSELFLIGFFPIAVILIRCPGSRSTTARKALILLADSLFLVWGGAGSFFMLCAYSIVIYGLSILVYKVRHRLALAISLLLAAAPLIVVKYTVSVIQAINNAMHFHVDVPSMIVPTGISFFTFEAISLLVDIYKGKTVKCPALVNTFLYLTFFPTVTSGPIIRYNEFEKGLCSGFPGRARTSRVSADADPIAEAPTSAVYPARDYTAVIDRIVIGLCKKILIADKIAYLADYYFSGTALGKSYSCIGLWIGSIAYTLQLYFDFSGYSDMAVGIGKLLGFDLRENFDRPYQAGSISDFWKRWHISLTQWFREYVYIPLGGNRCSENRHILNMLAVWLLTGIWHGADWTFLIWGIGYFVLLTAEKYILRKNKQIRVHDIPGQKKARGAGIIGHVYTLFFVNLLWVPFRADNLSTAARYIRGMFGGGSGMIEEKAIRFIPFLLFVMLLCFPWEKLLSGISQKKWFAFLRGAVLIALAALAVCGVVNSSYTPYIYGSF